MAAGQGRFGRIEACEKLIFNPPQPQPLSPSKPGEKGAVGRSPLHFLHFLRFLRFTDPFSGWRVKCRNNRPAVAVLSI